MVDIVIPCEAFARLSNVLRSMPADIDEHFKTIRYDNGSLIACNRTVMAIEYIGGPGGIVHIKADNALIAQSVKEAPFASKLTINVNDMLKFAVAKSTLGYIHPGNCGFWSEAPTDFNRWRIVAMQTGEPAKTNKGGMFWDAANIANLAAASPSGRLVFEETIDASGKRPTLIRDINDYNWCAVFNPFSTGECYAPATLPTWMSK